MKMEVSGKNEQREMRSSYHIFPMPNQCVLVAMKMSLFAKNSIFDIFMNLSIELSKWPSPPDRGQTQTLKP
jgi:hypothetical protein